MAKIKQIDLEIYSDIKIQKMYLKLISKTFNVVDESNFDNFPTPILSFLMDNPNELIINQNRINRLLSLFDCIIIKRFIQKEIK